MNEHVRYHADCVLTEGELDLYMHAALDIQSDLKRAYFMPPSFDRENTEFFGKLLKVKMDRGQVTDPVDIVNEVLDMISTFAHVGKRVLYNNTHKEYK